MAIAGAMKVAGKALGKAVNVIKKKKKKLEKKGKAVKEKIRKDVNRKREINAKEFDATGSVQARNIQDKFVKTSKRNLKILNKTPDIVAGAAGATAQVGKKAIKVAKKAKADPKGTAKKAVQSVVGDTIPEAAGFITGGLAAAGAFALTSSIIKSNSSPEQEYTQERRSDGRFATIFKDKNANVVASAKQLSTKEIDDVRTRLAVLDSILDSTDPKTRSKEFKATVAYLATKYKISNITGKNLSIIIPNVEGGVQTRQG